MGIFKSKSKTYVSTSMSRMVSDKDYVPSYKMAMLEYTMSEASGSIRVSSQSLSDFLIQSASSNLLSKVSQARKYALRPDYAYGNTTGDLMLKEEVDVMEVMKDYLESTLLHPVALKYAVLGPMNNLHFLREMLVNQYDYNTVTNEVRTESIRIGKTCYLETAVIKYSKYTNQALIDPDTLLQYGVSTTSGKTDKRVENLKAAHVPWVNNYEGDHDIAVVTISYMDGEVQKKYDIELDFLAYEASRKPPEDGLDFSDTNNINPDAVAPSATPTLDGRDFFQAYYEHQVNGVVKRDYFTYLYDSGSIPLLDNLYTSQDKLGSYLPRMYARTQGRKCNADDLKDTAEYKSMVGLGKKLGINWTSWVDEIHKAVGSLEDVTQIFMTFGLPANTDDPIVQKYLFEYFMALYGQIPDKFATSAYKDLQQTIVGYGSKEGQTIRIQDKAYTQQMSFSSIGFMDIEGNIGPIGTHTSGTGKSNVNLGRVGSTLFKGLGKTTWNYYRRQITDTVFREVRIYNLTTTEYVQGGHTTVASGDDENLLIPLDLTLAPELNVRQRELLMAKSMYVVVNALKVIKEKWYQTGIFKAILFVGAVIISVYTNGGGMALYSAIIYAAAQTLVIGLLIQMVIKFLVVKLNINAGAALAVIAVIALIYGGYTSLTDSVGAFSITAPQLLNVASQAFAMSSQAFAVQLQESVKEFKALMADLEADKKALDAKAVELGVDGGIHPQLLMFEPPIQLGIRIGETPDDYIERSIHSGNIGVATNNIIEDHVANTTGLPSLQRIINNIQEIYA